MLIRRHLQTLRALGYPFFILAVDLAVIEVLSQMAALIVTQLSGANGPAFQDVAYYSKVVIAIPVLLLGARYFEKRSFAEVGFAPRHVARNVFLGMAISATVMCLTTLILALAGWYHIQSIQKGISDTTDTLLAGLLLYCVVAIQEEVIFRGILFRLLERGLGSWLALIISALTFGWFHIGNPGASWVSSLAIALEAGFTLAAAYMLTRNLWLCIGLHWGWNFFEGTIFGYNVSGNSPTVLVQSYTTGPSIWTGGDFGPEAGLVTVLLSAVLFSLLLYFAAKRGRICAPSFLNFAHMRHAEQPI